MVLIHYQFTGSSVAKRTMSTILIAATPDAMPVFFFYSTREENDDFNPLQEKHPPPHVAPADSTTDQWSTKAGECDRSGKLRGNAGVLVLRCHLVGDDQSQRDTTGCSDASQGSIDDPML